VPTSTRYCFPPVSMTAYMDPLDFTESTAGDARGAIGLSDMGLRPATAVARTMECTAERGFRSIETEIGYCLSLKRWSSHTLIVVGARQWTP
jgi:hypothetical protein